jgi:hypothetical protein
VGFQGVTVVKTTPFNYGWQGQMAPLACGFGMRNGVQGSSAGDSSGKVSRRKRKKLGLVEFWRTVETEAMDSFVLTLRAEGSGVSWICQVVLRLFNHQFLSLQLGKLNKGRCGRAIDAISTIKSALTLAQVSLSRLRGGFKMMLV